jgi:hypothetical protein
MGMSLGLDRRAGDVAAGADAQVGQARSHPPADGIEQAARVQFGQQPEAVAPADEDAARLLDRPRRVAVAVDAVQLIAGVQAALGHRLDVAIVVAQGVGDEEQPAHVTEELVHRRCQQAHPLRRPVAAAAQKHPHFACPPRPRPRPLPHRPRDGHQPQTGGVPAGEGG